MFAQLNAASVHQENAVSMMQLDMLRLQTLQTQLANVSMQSTLVIGFAIAMLGGDNMSPLMDDMGQRCLYKSWAHMLLGLLFFLFVAACVSYCFIVVCLASFLKQAAQQTALVVSTRASVANTQVHIRLVFQLFVRSIFCFIIAAALLIWLFAGLPSRVLWDAGAAEHDWTGATEEDYVSALDDGEFTITCLNRHSASDELARNTYAYSLAGCTTLLIGSMCAWGLRTFHRVQATYEPRALLSWYSQYRLEEKRKCHDAADAASAVGVNKAQTRRASASDPGLRKKKQPTAAELVGTEAATYYALPENDQYSDDSVTGGPD